jgi:predicted enzyme related to lactoylglutathione lyase
MSQHVIANDQRSSTRASLGRGGRFFWSELMTRDTTTGTKLYTTLFGWKTKVSEVGGFTHTHWQNDGADIGGMMAIQEQWGPGPGGRNRGNSKTPIRQVSRATTRLGYRMVPRPIQTPCGPEISARRQCMQNWLG